MLISVINQQVNDFSTFQNVWSKGVIISIVVAQCSLKHGTVCRMSVTISRGHDCVDMTGNCRDLCHKQSIVLWSRFRNKRKDTGTGIPLVASQYWYRLLTTLKVQIRVPSIYMYASIDIHTLFIWVFPSWRVFSHSKGFYSPWGFPLVCVGPPQT